MKQVRIITKQSFEQTDWEKELELDEPMTFEDYVNMELAIIYSEDNQFVDSISHSDDLERFVITYNVKQTKR